MPNETHRLDDTFRALADPTRRAVLARLSREGPASVSALARSFDMAMPSFLQHLRVLEDSGLIRTEKAGRVRTCRLEAGALAAPEDWLAEQRALWSASLDRLEAYVAEIQTRRDDRETDHDS